MTTAAKNYDVADLALADSGRRGSNGRPAHAGPGLDSRALRAREAARGHPARPLPPRDERPRTSSARWSRVAPRSPCAPRTRSPPRTTSRPRAATATTSRSTRSRVRATKAYYSHINAVCHEHPKITMDDGADVIGVLHSERPDQLSEVIGGTEETTTGLLRLRALEAEGSSAFRSSRSTKPTTKHLFDNRYSTGQFTLDGIIPPPTSDRRQARGRRRLRLVRSRRRRAGQGDGRARDRLRGRSAAAPRGAPMDGYEAMPGVEPPARATSSSP